LAFEALGNDQNWKEVTQDQDGVTQFRYRYRLRAHGPGFSQASALAWSRSVTSPPLMAMGSLPKKWLGRSHLEIDPARAVALSLKPADENPAGQVVVRLWETSGQAGLVPIKAPGFHQAREIDLLERHRRPLSIRKDQLAVPARGYGFSAVQLER
jgi:hypothetical protein